jgi:hypothetical protein
VPLEAYGDRLLALPAEGVVRHGAVLPSLTDPSERNWAIFLAVFAFSEIISRILLLFYTDKEHLVGR